MRSDTLYCYDGWVSVVAEPNRTPTDTSFRLDQVLELVSVYDRIHTFTGARSGPTSLGSP